MLPLVTMLVFLVSAVFAMLGLGGGMLYVPILHWLGFGLQSVVIPLALLLNGVNTLLALLPYGRSGLVDWRGGSPMALAALLAAPVGARVAHLIPDRVLVLLFAVLVLVAAVRTLVAARQAEPSRTLPIGRRILIGSLVAAAAGFLGGLVGIGGGFVIGPLLMWIGYETKRAAATTAYVVTFSSFSGFLSHVGHMTLKWPLLLALLSAVLVASLLGSWFMAARARSEWVRWVYGCLLLGVAAKLLV
jgi:uncharacterized membrane protein YfcA